mmetsp:Transcript_64532/g.75702  ORF Transcript_64532/g.75702 Transcript_64532/m.75702 type:complete len:107 (+) Transcript_64532:188-508(+)
MLIFHASKFCTAETSLESMYNPSRRRVHGSSSRSSGRYQLLLLTPSSLTKRYIRATTAGFPAIYANSHRRPGVPANASKNNDLSAVWSRCAFRIAPQRIHGRNIQP